MMMVYVFEKCIVVIYSSWSIARIFGLFFHVNRSRVLFFFFFFAQEKFKQITFQIKYDWDIAMRQFTKGIKDAYEGTII
jgi:hypothetical protein